MADLRENVYRALDNALENGYDQRKLDPTEVAVELGTYDSEISGMIEDLEGQPNEIQATEDLQKELVGYVTAWQRSKL